MNTANRFMIRPAPNTKAMSDEDHIAADNLQNNEESITGMNGAIGKESAVSLIDPANERKLTRDAKQLTRANHQFIKSLINKRRPLKRNMNDLMTTTIASEPSIANAPSTEPKHPIGFNAERQVWASCKAFKVEIKIEIPPEGNVIGSHFLYK